MSQEALEAERQQIENYYAHHADSQTVTITASPDSSLIGETFPGLFDENFLAIAKDGEVPKRSKQKRITAYASETALSLRNCKVLIGGNEYQVSTIEPDRWEVVIWLT